MKERTYCYWSVALGERRAGLERCVRTARECGIPQPFHVFTDAPIPGCECYDAMDVPMPAGFEPLVYLKAGLAKLSFEYFVWVDPQTEFRSPPKDVLRALSRSPLHVPMETPIEPRGPAAPLHDYRPADYRAAFCAAGATGDVYASRAAFWIVHREAIDCVCDLATYFCRRAHAASQPANLGAGLGFAMHLLCADPSLHTVRARPDLWGAAAPGWDPAQGRGPWPHYCPWAADSTLVDPSVVYRADADVPGSASGGARIEARAFGA